ALKLLPFAGFATAMLTAFYMFRQYFLTFEGKPRDEHAYEHAHESPKAMWIPLVVLATLAVCAGWFSGSFKALLPYSDRESIVAQYANYHSEAGRALPPVTAVVAAMPHAVDLHE